LRDVLKNESAVEKEASDKKQQRNKRGETDSREETCNDCNERNGIEQNPFSLIYIYVTFSVGIIEDRAEDPLFGEYAGIFLIPDLIEGNLIVGELVFKINPRKMRRFPLHKEKTDQADEEEQYQQGGKKQQKS
jgi:hypothetical protein